MRALTCCHAFVIVLSTCTWALAQTPPAESLPEAEAPAQPPTMPIEPSPATAAPSAPQESLPPAPAAPPGALGTCLLGAHGGLSAADAVTVSKVVCDEVRMRSSANASYQVEFQRLGKVGILSLAEVDSTGRVVDRRTLRLSNIEEVFTAAPRLAEALVEKKAIEQTQQVDNLVGEEARVQRKKYGKTHFGVGIIGTAFPGGTGAIAPGLDVALYHETARAAIGGDLRLASGSSGDEYSYYDGGDSDYSSGSFVALSVGGRYFTSLNDATPFVGGGLSWSGTNAAADGFDGDNDGFSAFAEAGVEVFRTHKTHLNVGIRATVPFYTLESTTYVMPGPSAADGSYTPPTQEHSSKYVVPLTLNATVLF